MSLSPDQITDLFRRADGQYAFARWGRPLAPVVFGVTDDTLTIVKQAVVTVAGLANHEMTEVDQDLGANLMIFFVADWAELADTPHLVKLVPDIVPLTARLIEADANQYRIFRFDDAGAIMACMVFLRIDGHLAEVPADALALSQMVQAITCWSDSAFRTTLPVDYIDGVLQVDPDIAALIRAAYDPVLPVASQDEAHALRLFARVQVLANA
ncbi:hypothetical protein [Pseudoruegeria sp. SK021]|uniref:hypothetical protein n=1 Tax=Pseudoruegeria sp. SK021 TaxID=1933035 RepID=UPI000A24A0AB|nr:hypothetical protein [Pseudoruegeria sp. SK021]OSP56539.1 hypothetical protein BV911_00820 [Pseudoruegeria sp. SK021]